MRRIILTALLLPFPLFAQWQEFSTVSEDSVWASSVLQETIGGNEIIYTPEQLFDRNYKTPWVEGVTGWGIGEHVTVRTDRLISSFSIVNGFARSGSVYLKNGRVKSMRVSFLAGFSPPGMVSENDYYLYFLKEYISANSIPLPDSPELYTIPFPLSFEEQEKYLRTAWFDFRHEQPELASLILESTFGNPDISEALSDSDIYLIYEIHGFIGVRIYIHEVYPGSKYTDTCISELSLQLE